MSTITNNSCMMVLPNKILEQIMFYVNEDDNEYDRNDGIFKCIHVCKNWKTIAQLVGYSIITLQNVSQWWKLQKAMTNKSTSANFVKSLNSKFPMTASELETISNLFMYIEHLNTAKPDDNFYLSLVNLHNVEGKFNQLKSFSPGYEQSSFHSYARCAQEFHKTLTKLRFVGFNLINSPYTDSRIDFKSFSHLTELFIDDDGMHFTSPAPMQIYWFDSVIDNCTFLESLDFISRHIGSTNNAEPVDLSVIKPKTSVKKLSVTMEITNDNNALSYIKHKFLRLKQFHFVNNREKGRDDTIRLLHENEIGKFLTYASDIPAYNIQSIYVNQEGLDMALNYYYKTLPSSSKSMRKEIKISFSNRRDNLSMLLTACFDIKKPSSSSLQTTIINFNSERYYAKGSDGSALLDASFSTFFVRNGENIQHISIDFETDRFGTSPLRDTYFFLKPLMENCANLESLFVRNKGWMENHGELCLTSSIGSTLNYLEFKRCKIDVKLLTSLSREIHTLDTLKLESCSLYSSSQECGCQMKHVHMLNTVINSLYLKNNVEYTDDIDRSSTLVTFEIRKTAPKTKVNRFMLNLKEDSNQQRRGPRQVVTSHFYCPLNKCRRNLRYSINCKSINKIIITESFGEAEVNCGELIYDILSTTDITKEKVFIRTSLF